MLCTCLLVWQFRVSFAGKGQTIYELVGEKAATTGASEVGKGVVLSGIPAEQMAAAQAMARLGTDDK